MVAYAVKNFRGLKEPDISLANLQKPKTGSYLARRPIVCISKINFDINLLCSFFSSDLPARMLTDLHFLFPLILFLSKFSLNDR